MMKSLNENSRTRIPTGKVTTSNYRIFLLIGFVAMPAIMAFWLWYQHKASSQLLLATHIPPLVTSGAPVNSTAQAMSNPQATQLTIAQAAVAHAPKDINKRWQLADAYQKVGQLDKAAIQLQEITRLAPQKPEAREALGKTYLALQRFKEAEITYIDLIQQQPKSASAWIGLSGALYHQGSYYEASEAARRANTLHPNDSARYVLALCLMQCGLQVPNLDTGLYFAQLQEARDELERLAKIWPQNGDIYYRLGRTYLGMSDGTKAVKNLMRARELMPSKVDVLFQLVKAYIKLGDNNNALKTVEEALKQFPQEADLWNLRGQLYLSHDDPDALQKALESCQQAVRLNPDKAIFRDRLGVAYQRSGKLAESCQEFETEIKLNPHNIFPYQQLAMLYRRRGDNAQAMKYAQAASSQVTQEQQLKQLQVESRDYPDNVKLHLAIAGHFRDLGYVGAARDEYLRAIKLDPTNERAHKGLAALTSSLTRIQQAKEHTS